MVIPALRGPSCSQRQALRMKPAEVVWRPGILRNATIPTLTNATAAQITPRVSVRSCGFCFNLHANSPVFAGFCSSRAGPCFTAGTGKPGRQRFEFVLVKRNFSFPQRAVNL